MATKKKNFQWEIRLGLAIIVLVLIILNFASHYTLYRLRNSVQVELNDDLNEAAVVTANRIKQSPQPELSDSVLNDIKYGYQLRNLLIEPLDYERSLILYGDSLPDFEFLGLEKSIRARELQPLLNAQPVVVHRSGSSRNLLLFPAEFRGSKYIIAIEKESSLLSSIEQAGTVLLVAGLLGIGVIIFASYKFVGFVIHPFKRLRDEARRSGRLTGEGSDDVSQLIASYEEIINDLRLKEHELEAQMNMILEMSGGLAHQLRNSIGGIVGLARLIQKRAHTDKITSDNVEYLMRESQEAETLVSRFMDFARPLQLYEENFRLSELLHEIVRALVRQFEKVSVIFDHDDQAVFRGDRLLLKQALTNVMVNAAQAFGAGDGEISVKTDRQSGRFVLTIADNGPGIPTEYRDKIFTPFVSGSPSGTGLGLALARKIIIALDGRIEFDSQIGIGTEFHFIFPESRLAVEASAQEVPEAVS